MNRDDIIAGLREIDDMLSEGGLGRGRILIAGSGALMLAVGDFRQTSDVDVIECTPNVLGLLAECEVDFNNAVSTYAYSVPGGIETVGVDAGTVLLEVEALTPETVAVMKLVAGRASDLDDVAALSGAIDMDAVAGKVGSWDFAADMPDDAAWQEVKDRLARTMSGKEGGDGR